MAVLPLVSRQSKSYLPVAVEVALPTIDQVVGTTPNPPEEATCAPFIIHTAVLPGGVTPGDIALGVAVISWVAVAALRANSSPDCSR